MSTAWIISGTNFVLDSRQIAAAILINGSIKVLLKGYAVVIEIQPAGQPAEDILNKIKELMGLFAEGGETQIEPPVPESHKSAQE